MRLQASRALVPVMFVILSIATIPARGGDEVRSFKIKSADGSEVARFEVDTSSVAIESEAGDESLRLSTRIEDLGKHAYTGTGGPFQVSMREEGFKIKGASGEELWKVKYKPGKVKISGPGGAPVIEVKAKDDGRHKVSVDDVEVGKSNFYVEDGRIKVKDASGEARYKVDTDANSGAFALMLVDRIPRPVRFVLMAELVLAGR